MFDILEMETFYNYDVATKTWKIYSNYKKHFAMLRKLCKKLHISYTEIDGIFKCEIPEHLVDLQLLIVK